MFWFHLWDSFWYGLFYLCIQLHHSGDMTMIMIIIFEMSYAFGALLVACELSQRVNVAFEECDKIIEQFDWYRFPLEIQRILPTIIIYAQRPVEIKCFGSMACNRAAFKDVCATLTILYIPLKTI